MKNMKKKKWKKNMMRYYVLIQLETDESLWLRTFVAWRKRKHAECAETPVKIKGAVNTCYIHYIVYNTGRNEYIVWWIRWFDNTQYHKIDKIFAYNATFENVVQSQKPFCTVVVACGINASWQFPPISFQSHRGNSSVSKKHGCKLLRLR